MKLARATASLLAAMPLALATPAQAFFVDGDGHYALRGETRTNEAFAKDSGYYQAIEQSFRLHGEARFNDQSSMNLEFKLFDNPRESYLGDYSKSGGRVPCEPYEYAPAVDSNGNPDPAEQADQDANPKNQDSLPCNHPNTGEPRYEPYTPRVTKAYVRYAFDYCILEAGRRPRQWGLGMFLDAGDKPFDTDASVFDGVTCNVNIQKTQTLGFSVGYDKIAETGAYNYLGDDEHTTRRFGANDTGDDVDQFFFTIEYDDRKANAGATFTKQVGVYFAQVNSRKLSDGGSNTDLKFLDLYTGFFFSDLAFRNELLFRMGKSADPNWIGLGGAFRDDGTQATNKLNAIALAGGFEWTLSRSGAAVGPVEFNKGDATRHVIFLNYALAPGDSDGWFDGPANAEPGEEAVSIDHRDSSVSAVSFHRNFKPALILFNGRPESDRLNVDGAFNPSRVENANVYYTCYRYENMSIGNFEVKYITASLNKSIPGPVKTAYNERNANLPNCTDEITTGCDDGDRPAGFYGNTLGHELDFTYAYKIGRDAELGLAAAGALPGTAWRTNESRKPVNNFLLQSSVVFNF
jgi:hypothetical protein